MPNGLILSLIVAGGLASLAVLLGVAAGLRWRWLAVATGLLLVHDALVTNAYRALPRLLPFEGGNWQGKLLALAGTLVAAWMLGRRRAGLTLAQAPGSLRPALAVMAAYAALYTALALLTPGEGGSAADLAFQLTMPGLEEEGFYRGVLLLAFDRALPGRWRFAGVDWGWGAVLTSLAFGLDHALSLGAGGLALDPAYLAMTGLPSLVAVWVRYRTGSVALPVVMHNWGNVAATLV